MKAHRLVLIEWVDSSSGRGWQSLDDLHEVKPLTCKSVGWLVADTAEYKVVVGHISGWGQSVVPFGTGELSIPTAAVKRIRTLREKSPR